MLRDGPMTVKFCQWCTIPFVDPRSYEFLSSQQPWWHLLTMSASCFAGTNKSCCLPEWKRLPCEKDLSQSMLMLILTTTVVSPVYNKSHWYNKHVILQGVYKVHKFLPLVRCAHQEYFKHAGRRSRRQTKQIMVMKPVYSSQISWDYNPVVVSKALGDTYQWCDNVI